METRQANKINQNDTKTGQANENRADNTFYEQYANMSDAEIAKLRSVRQSRTSISGKVLQTYVPEEFKKKNLHYQWFVYDPLEIDRMVKDGWVVVSDEKLAKLKGCSTTSEIKIPSGLTTNRGEPEFLILMAIHKVIFDADMRAQKERMIDFDKDINVGHSIVDETGGQIKEDLQFKSKEVSIE